MSAPGVGKVFGGGTGTACVFDRASAAVGLSFNGDTDIETARAFTAGLGATGGGLAAFGVVPTGLP
jgi:hypothetical protein